MAQLQFKGKPFVQNHHLLVVICTKQAKARNWGDLGSQMKDKVLCFEVLAEDEWEAKLNEILQA